ncbi:photosystem II protein Y [Coleofasciculus sp. FACHB-712]|jgi:photosystem II PsbY protein|nr:MULTISPECIES: photosystem II protein Y [unclassified Coleofasciculus]MBD1944917.1 photosystem II protein Y [Coleofasciculus sp. FACHB-712]MBD2085364.1 photosystem II protein Y [Coleofasciculus sp. FACHB-542]
MEFDWRVLIVLLPIVAAAGWAGFNILPYALKQIQGFLNRS